MKKKIKRSDLFALLNAFEAAKDLQGVKFGYAVAKNKANILAERKCVDEAGKPSKEYFEFDKRRLELCEEHCDKENGKPVKIFNPITRQEVYAGLDGNKKFNAAVDALTEEYKDVTEAFKQQREEVNKLLDEEIEFDFYMVEFSEIPENITAGQMAGLEPIINPPE